MPYVNIPETNLGGTIGKLVGKLEGDISGKAIEQVNKLQSQFRSEGCPANLSRVRNQKNGVDQATSAINGRISKFKSLPGKLKGPLGGLKAALKIILSLPIPQAVPPGIGLPINITTVYADVMHLLKEFIKQIGDTVSALEYILKGPSGQLKSIKRALAGVEIALKTCEIEKALKDKLEDGTLTLNDLSSLNLLNDENDLIFADLSPKFLGLDVNQDGIEADNRSVLEIVEESNRSLDDVIKVLVLNKQLTEGTTTNLSQTIAGNLNATEASINLGVDNNNLNTGTRTEETNINGTQGNLSTIGGNLSSIGTLDRQQKNDSDDALNKLVSSLDSLQGSNIDEQIKKDITQLIDLFQADDRNIQQSDDKYKHLGPDGTEYSLEILADPDSPTIAPRRFAVAKNPANVTVVTGPKSFSSSTDILLDEIKFRIDNQLP